MGAPAQRPVDDEQVVGGRMGGAERDREPDLRVGQLLLQRERQPVDARTPGQPRWIRAAFRRDVGRGGRGEQAALDADAGDPGGPVAGDQARRV